MPKHPYRAFLPLHREGEELRDLLLRIDGVLYHGRLFCNPKDSVDLVHLRVERNALARIVDPRRRGRRELPPEAYQAVTALERIYEAELVKPKAEQRTQRRIVADYIRDAIM